MVISGLVSETQTPKIASQTSHHAKEKFGGEDTQALSQNEGIGQKIKQASDGGPLNVKTPSRRKSRQQQSKP